MSEQIRSNQDLGQILTDNMHRMKYYGICYLIFVLWSMDEINYLEYKEIKRLLNKFNPCGHEGYYWPPGDFEPRVKWIKEHLINQKNHEKV